MFMLLNFFWCMLTTTSFDLWMSKSTYDILVINFLNENWQPEKVTIGVFETTKTISQALAKNLKNLLDSYG
jgi:hypothetical protein